MSHMTISVFCYNYALLLHLLLSMCLPGVWCLLLEPDLTSCVYEDFIMLLPLQKTVSNTLMASNTF